LKQNRPNISQTDFLSKSIHNLCLGELRRKNWTTSVFLQKNAQSKQSPIGRKFAPFGPPDSDRLFNEGFLKEGRQKKALLFS
jgi:hypothetical protein